MYRNSYGFFTIKVRLLNGDRIEINVRKDYTIQKLKEIIQDKTNISKDRLYLAFMKILEDEKKTLEYYGITRSVSILQISEPVGGGGFGLNTVDVSKNNTRIIELDKNAPFHRIVGEGLSIQAICKNECKVKDHIVYCHIGLVRDYDILQHLSEIKCPSCKKMVYPKNFGFIHCKYAVYYEKWENGKKYAGDVLGKAENEFILFDEYSSGNDNFIRIVFDVCRLNEDI